MNFSNFDRCLQSLIQNDDKPLCYWVEHSSSISDVQVRDVIDACKNVRSSNLLKQRQHLHAYGLDLNQYSRIDIDSQISLINRIFFKHPHILLGTNRVAHIVNVMSFIAEDLQSKCFEINDALSHRNICSAFEVLPKDVQEHIKLLTIKTCSKKVSRVLNDENIKEYLRFLEKPILQENREKAIEYTAALGFREYRWENGDFRYTPAEKRDVFAMIKEQLANWPEIEYLPDDRKKMIHQMGQLTNLKAGSIRAAVSQALEAPKKTTT